MVGVSKQDGVSVGQVSAMVDRSEATLTNKYGHLICLQKTVSLIMESLAAEMATMTNCKLTVQASEQLRR
jgi:hypothetical protein